MLLRRWRILIEKKIFFLGIADPIPFFRAPVLRRVKKVQLWYATQDIRAPITIHALCSALQNTHTRL